MESWNRDRPWPRDIRSQFFFCDLIFRKRRPLPCLLAGLMVSSGMSNPRLSITVNGGPPEKKMAALTGASALDMPATS
ncbi:hypothetical protein ALUC_80705S [Aspergillus luchuensis]|nr:hypothetical protein ALUC_80705S [Aspergillus luchuensis]